MRVASFPREIWLREYFSYQPGEHFSAIEPTQQGKTHVTYQAADIAMTQNPQLRFVSLMPKARDPATNKWAAALELKVIDNWPPPKVWFGNKPRGYVLWPKHLKGADPEMNRAHLAKIFRACLTDQFQQGECITLADDVYNLAVLLGLNADLEEHWTAGGGGGAGLWSTAQKPSGTLAGSVSSFVYNCPTHLLLGYDPDLRNRKRFSEIGGVNSEVVAQTVAGLGITRIQTGQGVKPISDKLYIDKRGPYMGIIGP